jgi:hypothetical protein
MEVQLVRLGTSGVVIPTPAFSKLEREAKRLGKAHFGAFREQVRRQVAMLTTPQQQVA